MANSRGGNAVERRMYRSLLCCSPCLPLRGLAQSSFLVFVYHVFADLRPHSITCTHTFIGCVMEMCSYSFLNQLKSLTLKQTPLFRNYQIFQETIGPIPMEVVASCFLFQAPMTGPQKSLSAGEEHIKTLLHLQTRAAVRYLSTSNSSLFIFR